MGRRQTRQGGQQTDQESDHEHYGHGPGGDPAPADDFRKRNGVRSQVPAQFSDGSETPEQRDPEGDQTVPPFDFLALADGPGMIGNRHFADLKSEAQQLGGDLGFPVESVARDRHGTQQVSVERFVAGRFVGQLGIVKQVDPPGQQQAAEEEGRCGKHAVAVVCLSGAVNDLAFAVQDRSDAAGKIIGVIFQIGILDDDHGAGRFPNTGLDRGALAAVFPVDQFQDMAGGVPVLFDPFAAELRSAVGRAVVDHQDLHGHGHIGMQDVVQQGLDGFLFIVDRDDDR